MEKSRNTDVQLFSYPLDFDSLPTCESKLKSFEECMRTVQGSPLSNSTHRCSNTALHIHPMVENIDNLDESCRNVMPHLFELKQKMGPLQKNKYEIGVGTSPLLSFWKVVERHQRFDRYKDEIFEAIEKDVNLLNTGS